MRKIFVILAVALALLVTLRDDARAQSPALEVGSPRSFTVGGNLAFSVKFLCGTIAPGPGLPLAAGTYLTAINIHNLSGSVTHITYAFNGLLKDSFFLSPGVVSLDCRNIVMGGGPLFPGSFAPGDPFSEGFVTLSAVEAKGRLLNVVPVYTVATVPQ
jgi:hypothetical protein